MKPIAADRWKPVFWGIALSILVGLSQQPSSVHAQEGVIRDSEIEQLMRDYIRPVLRSSGLSQGSTQVVILNSRRLDAFVVDGRRIFLHAGTLIESKTPNEVIGVIAHELGHLKGGHLIRQRQELKNAQTLAVVGALLGVGAAVAGGGLGASGKDTIQAAQGILLGSQELASRTFLKYKRAEELAADQAAVSFLVAANQSPAGLLRVFETLKRNTLALTESEGYLVTHPSPADRIQRLRTLVSRSKSRNQIDPPSLVRRHLMARAKLVGFLSTSKREVLNTYPASDKGLPAQYARAIAAFRFTGIRSALPLLNLLIAKQPQNPYFHELKGQALLESGRASEAVHPLSKAVKLAPDAPLIRILYAHALLETNTRKNIRRAELELTRAVQKEKANPEAYRLQARAYAAVGKIPLADLATALASYYSGNRARARQFATRAKKRLSKNSPAWIQADDLLRRR